jgi:hypothetical protein
MSPCRCLGDGQIRIPDLEAMRTGGAFPSRSRHLATQKCPRVTVLVRPAGHNRGTNPARQRPHLDRVAALT